MEDGGDSKWTIGSTHGRDPAGRRFLPVLLKDVAGLVPGAFRVSSFCILSVPALVEISSKTSPVLLVYLFRVVVEGISF